MNTTKPAKLPKRSDSETNKGVLEVPAEPSTPASEAGGRGGLDPTRYGDWEKAGRCIDF